jgi:hypothetical protein
MDTNRNPDDELHKGLEERPPDGNIEATQVRDRQAHQDRGDEPGVVADDVADGRDAHHARQLAGGAEHIAQVKLAQAEPQHRDADRRAGRADGDG